MPRPRTLTHLVLSTIVVLVLARIPARADGPHKEAGAWLPLLTPRGTEEARITYYGPKYTSDDPCNAGVWYDPEGWFVAVGPSMLAEARALAEEPWPIVLVEINGERYAFPVWDTGGSTDGVELEVDLPDATWLELTGRPADDGLVLGRVWVWTGGEVIGWW